MKASTLLAAACVAASVLSAPECAWALPTYKVSAVLPTLPSSGSSYTNLYLSNSGVIAGGIHGVFGTPSTAFVWRESTGLTSLSSPFGLSSYVNGINSQGTVVGAVNIDSSTTTAWAWGPDGTSQNIATLAGLPATASTLTGINDNGVVTGYYNAQGSQDQAFTWSPTQGRIDLERSGDFFGQLAGNHTFKINNAGYTAGYTQIGQAAVWDPSGNIQVVGYMSEELGYPSEEKWATYATDINDSGTVVGYGAPYEPIFRAYTWTPENGMQMLALLPFMSSSGTFDINNHGVAVGYSYNRWDFSIEQEATVWTDAATAISLNALIDASDPLKGSFHLFDAQAINDKGQIVAFGYFENEGKARPFLLSPVPEPEAMALLMAGLAVSMAAHRCRRTRRETMA